MERFREYTHTTPKPTLKTIHTNRMENYWGLLKRTIKGTCSGTSANSLSATMSGSIKTLSGP